MKKAICLFVFAVLLVNVSCVFTESEQVRTKRQIENYLNASIPDDVTDMKIKVDYPYDGYKESYTYIKLTMPQPSYDNLMHTMKMKSLSPRIITGEWKTHMADKHDGMFSWWNPDLSEKQPSTVYWKSEPDAKRMTFAKYEATSAFTIVHSDMP